MFDYLLNLDKKYTGLTDLQKKMVQFFYMGLNDKEIVKEMDGGSTSTIRNHRFTLRENETSKSIFSVNGTVRRKIESANEICTYS